MDTLPDKLTYPIIHDLFQVAVTKKDELENRKQ